MRPRKDENFKLNSRVSQDWKIVAGEVGILKGLTAGSGELRHSIHNNGATNHVRLDGEGEGRKGCGRI